MSKNSLGLSFDRVDMMNKALDGAWKRNNVLLNNVANANTPEYKRKDVDFQSVLKNELEGNNSLKMKTTNEKHISSNDNSNSIKVKTTNNFSARKDKNNVNVDIEMAEITKNSITYNALVGQTTKEFKKWRMIIDEGGR